MYAGTKVNWHEVLMPDSTVAANDESLPLFLCLFSSDKGTEDVTEFSQASFRAMYGDNPDFFKYGQPLIQAHAILAAGGKIMGKRIVANDATLANTYILASVQDNDGKAKITYTAKTIDGATTFDEVETAALSEFDDESGVYPLFVIADNGRGKSVKKFNITPDYEAARKLPYMVYKMSDIEGAYTRESCRFAVYPSAIGTVNGTKRNLFLTKNSMAQLQVEAIDNVMEAFLTKISAITGLTMDDIYDMDPLFGRSRKNAQSELIEIDTTSPAIVLNNANGIEIKSGTDGAFANGPFVKGIASEAWSTAAVTFLTGGASGEYREIYDLDQHKIDFCVDANYPDTVKAAIASLANFREDFYYLRDCTTDVNSIADVEVKLATYDRSPFIGDNCSTYDIIDVYSSKQIKVTMLHGIATDLVRHYYTNPAAPLAGEFNNFVVTEAIPGTLNIIPRVYPTADGEVIDEKQKLDDLRVNYLNYSSDINTLAVQSTYTSQDHEGPLSYAGNVIVTQMLIKAIRRYCPKIRFMLMDIGTTDFSKYKALIDDNVISKYKSHFKSVELVYTRDDDMVAAKIFNASLLCYYRDFPAGEIFDVFAIEGSPDNNPVSL